MRVIRLMDEPNWQSRLSPIEEIFFATSPSAKTLRPDERGPLQNARLLEAHAKGSSWICLVQPVVSREATEAMKKLEAAIVAA